MLKVTSPNEPEMFGTDLALPQFSDADIVELEPFGPLAAPVASRDGSPLYTFGTGGIKGPVCKHNHNPSYTEEARQARVKGSIILDAVVKTDGTLEEARILRGLPFGLNGQALAATRSWRCEPGLKEGKPVSVLVAFEINFQMK